MHMMEQTPEAEAGSHRTSGHRIENAPLTEYQMFHPDFREGGVPRHVYGTSLRLKMGRHEVT
jgi:hypothetical protein